VRADDTLSGDAELQHLDEMTCLLYIERQLDRARAQEVSAHTQECAACRTLLRALERESRLLTRAMLEEEEALPARLARFQERARRSMQWIWTVAFGLAATGVYALYSTYIVPLQDELEKDGLGGSNLLSLLIFQGAFWKGWRSMITLLEVLALVTLAGFAVAFFRKRVRRGSVLALVLTGLCASLLLQPAPVMASETRRGESVGVAQDETIKGDIFLFGERVRIDGTVEGDVFLFGHNASVTGHVKGDVIAFAQTLEVNGQVDGNVRAFTNTLTIRGTVAKNVLTFDEVVNIESGGKIGGSLTLFVETLNLEGVLGKDLFMFGKHLAVSGKIDGAVKMKGDLLTINSSAQVAGPIHFEGNKEPEVSPQAKLAYPVDYHKMERKPQYMEGHYYVWQVIWLAAFVLFGLVLFQLMPRFAAEAVANAERYGASFGLGVLVFFGVPIAAVIACVTVVGLFVGISAFFIWYAALYFAQLIVGAMVGQWLMGRTQETWPLIGRMAVGIVIVRLATVVPALGGWVKFGVILWGLGAISLALYNRFQPTLASSAPSGPYMPPPLPPNTTVGGMQPA
jgi:cytoskeletal protein CcmA (bactofilin family)/anti-sigma factor RsiW